MSSAEFHQPIELTALRRIAEPKKGPSIRVRRNRSKAGLLAVAVGVVAGFGIYNLRDGDPDNCRLVGKTRVAAGRGVDDAVVRSERNLTPAEVRESIRASREANSEIIPRNGDVNIVHCTRNPNKSDTFVSVTPNLQ